MGLPQIIHCLHPASHDRLTSRAHIHAFGSEDLHAGEGVVGEEQLGDRRREVAQLPRTTGHIVICQQPGLPSGFGMVNLLFGLMRV